MKIIGGVSEQIDELVRMGHNLASYKYALYCCDGCNIIYSHKERVFGYRRPLSEEVTGAPQILYKLLDPLF